MSTVRLRRLSADYERLQQILARHPRIKLVHAEGVPPERYELEFRIRSMRQAGDELVSADRHRVEINLPLDYPRLPPQCRMLTPVFHPNIAPHAICVGDHWNAGEPIWSIVSRIGEMIAYQSYNVKSPLNGEAARWVEQNLDQLPTDRANLLLTAPSESSTSEAGSRRAARKVDSAATFVACPVCQAKLRVPPASSSSRIRCGRCQTVIDLADTGTG
jgi:ubiquitin-protein ligase